MFLKALKTLQIEFIENKTFFFFFLKYIRRRVRRNDVHRPRSLLTRFEAEWKRNEQKKKINPETIRNYFLRRSMIFGARHSVAYTVASVLQTAITRLIRSKMAPISGSIPDKVPETIYFQCSLGIPRTL